MVCKSAHQEELALHVAHDRLQPRRVELPVLAQHLSEEVAQFRVRASVRVQGSGLGSRVRVQGSGLGFRVRVQG